MRNGTIRIFMMIIGRSLITSHLKKYLQITLGSLNSAGDLLSFVRVPGDGGIKGIPEVHACSLAGKISRTILNKIDP